METKYLQQIFKSHYKSTLHRRLAKSPETCELLRQQASVFEWMNKNAVVESEKDSPPDWFLNYMENYREEMAAEITTKVSFIYKTVSVEKQTF